MSCPSFVSWIDELKNWGKVRIMKLSIKLSRIGKNLPDATRYICRAADVPCWDWLFRGAFYRLATNAERCKCRAVKTYCENRRRWASPSPGDRTLRGHWMRRLGGSQSGGPFQEICPVRSTSRQSLDWPVPCRAIFGTGRRQSVSFLTLTLCQPVFPDIRWVRCSSGWGSSHGNPVSLPSNSERRSRFTKYSLAFLSSVRKFFDLDLD